MTTQVRQLNPATYEGGFPVRAQVGDAPMVASRLPPDLDPWSAEGMGFQVAPQGMRVPRNAMNRGPGGRAAMMGLHNGGMWYGLGQSTGPNGEPVVEEEVPWYKKPWAIGLGVVAAVGATYYVATRMM